MKNSNICKFNMNRSSDLICENFIYETEKIQSTPGVAESNVLALVIKGSGVLVCGGTGYPLAEGTLFFIIKGDTFSVSSEGEFEYSYISFHGRRAGEYFERLSIDGENRVFASHTEVIPFWTECLHLSENGNIDMLSEAVLLYTMARLSPYKKEHSDVVSRMIALTQESFRDPDLSISVIAEALGYDAKYLSSIFKKKRGIAYTAYLRELRIKHALFLMEEGVVSVKNVAILSGFRDALYFSKIFTNSVGCAPKAYIAKLHEDR